ncbi:metallopeptidase family protein [Elioraea sp. Yellowstone]|jgi:acetylglutamate kinase|uniref:metallopeptidase family protein n=1 Tax=Elioraea sp. Yellowstone TaxID=2592070 RepID=UPI001151FE40|nr:metallopeptidase family protein [Elioraea sp. Yellowstone]TQF83840.1 metallopeptidase family protein [Elioraea sp. Yellowstone]
MRSFTTAPTTEEIVALADEALAWAQRHFPRDLAKLLEGVAIVVDDLPDDETVEEMGFDSPWELTGLWRGVPLTQRSVLQTPDQPEMVHLYRLPILAEWIETGEDLRSLVRNVLIHEIAHHFGFSDEEITRLEREG